jgi:hypothetical protein
MIPCWWVLVALERAGMRGGMLFGAADQARWQDEVVGTASLYVNSSDYGSGAVQVQLVLVAEQVPGRSGPGQREPVSCRYLVGM